MEKACCSHSKVVRIQEQLLSPHGTTNIEYWQCQDCSTRFWPESADTHCIKLLDDFAKHVVSGLVSEGIVQSSIPSLAKAAGMDQEWRQEIMAAVVKSGYEIADMMLKERNLWIQKILTKQ